MNDCSDTLYPSNLISELSLTQIISGAIGFDFDPSVWQLPEIQAQVKAINVYETETFTVFVKKNGIRMTITPAVRRSAKNAHDVYLEKQRQACLLGQGGKQTSTTYTCPFMMASCNGKTHACARCQPLLATGELATKPKWPKCPFGTASCTSAGNACARCRNALKE